jgi:hypothetical protein
MTDLEITKACAEAMGIKTIDAFGHPHIKHDHWPTRDTSCEKTGIGLKAYQPLHDDAQAMALVKKFRLRIGQSMVAGEKEPEQEWFVERNNHQYATDADLNRAICECVAKLRTPA